MYHLAFMFFDFLLWLVGAVDKTRRQMAQDYPALHGRS